ncbi:MAG: alpha/beta fold hydrolase [Gammaproteobacteria bacterium]|nr:alpha/beta fold hydrolase [Gammaproteobacteria bacterium]
MLARRMLAGFAMVIVVVGGLLWQAAGFCFFSATAAAAAILVGTRAALVLLSFVVAWWFGRGRPVKGRIGIAHTGSLMVRELIATLRTFFVLHPLEPWLAGTPEPVRDEAPVVLVHGFFSNAGYWRWAKQFLAARGISNVHTLNLEPPFGDIDGYLTQLAKRIEALESRAGPVVLIGHSMGGLVCRALLERGWHAGRIASVITLGTPHHGTLEAWFMTGTNVRQMRPGSDWLERLNRGKAPPVPIVSIYSYHDNIVVPHTAAILDGAKNLPVRGIGHLEMGFSDVVMDLVHSEILAAQLNC